MVPAETQKEGDIEYEYKVLQKTSEPETWKSTKLQHFFYRRLNKNDFIGQNKEKDTYDSTSK